MAGPLGQIGLLVGMTCALRTLAGWVGPRRSGLLLGLPSTTAVVLLGCAWERGTAEAALTAEVCLVGLVAAVSAPLAFARALGAGWGLYRSVAAAVAGYLAVAAALLWSPGPSPGPSGSLTLSLIGVAVVCRLAGRTRLPEDRAWSRGRLSGGWLLAARVSVPVAYVVALRGLRGVAGPVSSGRFITFPGASLALLVATHVEAGPGAAGRMAAAMPGGSLGTLAFLTFFRFATPAVGLGWGTAGAYASALLTLLSVEAVTNGAGLRRTVNRGRATVRRAVRRRVDGFRLGPAPHWALGAAMVGDRLRSPRRFSPGLEALAG